MKQQFKISPLATAILTLLCGSTVSSYADFNEVKSEVNNQSIQSALKENYAGQNFFEEFYINKNTDSLLNKNSTSAAKYCPKVWVTPIRSNTPAVAPDQATSIITADEAYYDPNGDSELKGNVIIDQQGRMIRANKVKIDKTQTFAKASGNVQIAQAGLLAQSDDVDYNLKTQTGKFSNSLYIVESTNAHGRAEKIERKSPNILRLENASYTTCPPEQSPTWKIKADSIELNEDTGRGVTKGTTLYVKNAPIMEIPYFNFPIDDRRTTGLLTPGFGYTNEGGVELEIPIYLNLAPNYDAILSPRYISQRGLMAEADFRYLTPKLGNGRIWGGYLGSDQKRNNEDRKDLHFLHDWKINNQWNTNLEYNYVSDKDYFADLDNNPNNRAILNQRTGWDLRYANGIPGLKAHFKVEEYQSVDKDVLDFDRPYARLPQLLLNYTGGNPQGLEFEFNNDSAYFYKKLHDLWEGPQTIGLNNEFVYEPSGTRIFNEISTRYNYRNQWSFFIPQASLRSINTFFDQNTVNRITSDELKNAKSYSYVVPEITLDSGLIFEKDGQYLQTITPRAFYAYAPYRNQSTAPNFDSTSASLNYDQLFNARRFYGHDRLEDNNFLSLGVSYSLFDTIGLERLKTSIGQSFYFSDRRVTLENNQDDPVNTEKNTGPVISIASQLSQNISVNANAIWMSNGLNAQRDLQVYYTTDRGSLYNLGYFNRRELFDRQDKFDQITASFMQPIKDNWFVMGHVQYDLDNKVPREYLLGLNYESCCWGVSVYGRSYYNDLDDVKSPDTRKKNSIMAEFTFKGLGGLNSKLKSVLENRILGFDQVKRNWTN